MLDARIVRKLEVAIEQALMQAIDDFGHNNLPLDPTERTVHLMAKAAVAVYESAVENGLENEP